MVTEDKKQKKSVGAEAAGNVYGNISNAATNYGIDKFSTPRGHGFAAERANHLYDILHGKDSVIAGDNNAKNGADRIVDGVNIQSKYCKTGAKCIKECFENDRFRYFNADGSPMQIEVPLDKYDDAVKAMEERIKKVRCLALQIRPKLKKLCAKVILHMSRLKILLKPVRWNPSRLTLPMVLLLPHIALALVPG